MNSSIRKCQKPKVSPPAASGLLHVPVESCEGSQGIKGTRTKHTFTSRSPSILEFKHRHKSSGIMSASTYNIVLTRRAPSKHHERLTQLNSIKRNNITSQQTLPTTVDLPTGVLRDLNQSYCLYFTGSSYETGYQIEN